MVRVSNWSMVDPMGRPTVRSRDELKIACCSRLVGEHLELGTDVVLVGHDIAGGLVEDVEQGMAVEVDPDEASGNATLVAGVGT
jgi:hypothetical protein